MTLHEAIKELVAQFGENIVTEVRLANLLADLNGYQDYPAMKMVLKDILKAGYGKKLFDIYSKDAQNAIRKSVNYAQTFAIESNYKEDLVSYAFDCLLFALGCITTINEPMTKGYDPYTKGNGDILDNLANQLASLQKQYLDLLDRLVTLPQNIYKDAPGYYSTEALNKLYAVEAKIAVIIKETNSTVSLDWCTNKRTEKIEYFKKQKTDAVAKGLDELRCQYKTLLASLIIVPKKFGIKRSGHYDDNGEKKLSSVEYDIKLNYYNMGNTYDNWCEKEKNKYLAKYHIDNKNVALQLSAKIGIPAAIFIGASGTGISYMTSSSAIEQFEHTIALGEQQATAGEYGKAILLFSDAKNNYTASFRPSHYQGIAVEHIKETVNNVTQSSVKMVEEGRLIDANTLLSSLPQEVISENKQLSEQYNSAKSALDKAINDGLDNLISDIASNHGKLGDTSKQKLNELLKINPNDYWLNFIKNKEK